MLGGQSLSCAAPVRLAAEPASIHAGESAVVRWQAPDGGRALLLGVGSVAASGSLSVAPAQTTEYVLITESPSGVVVKNARVAVAGAKGEHPYPEAADYRFPLSGDCKLTSFTGFLGRLHDLLQGMKLSVDPFKRDDHVIFRTSFADRRDLLQEDDEQNHIGARRIAYLVDVGPWDAQSGMATVTVKALIEYRKTIEETWRSENRDAIYEKHLSPLLQQIKTLSP